MFFLETVYKINASSNRMSVRIALKYLIHGVSSKLATLSNKTYREIAALPNSNKLKSPLNKAIMFFYVYLCLWKILLRNTIHFHLYYNRMGPTYKRNK